MRQLVQEVNGAQSDRELEHESEIESLEEKWETLKKSTKVSECMLSFLIVGKNIETQ